MNGNMVYNGDTDIKRAAEDAHSAAVLVACGMGLVLIVSIYLLCSAIGRLWEIYHEPSYPDPVCETCGAVLDGSSTVCKADLLENGGVLMVARGKAEP